MEQPVTQYSSSGPVFNIFGSSTSRDIDFLVVLSVKPTPQEVTSIAKGYEVQLKSLLSPDGSKELDCNLGVLENGVLVWVYKGTCDISNNAIYDTYKLHKQYHECIIKKRMDRNVPYLIIRTIRILVCKVTRTSIRGIARAALKKIPFEQYKFLSTLDFTTFTYNEKRTSSIDNYKCIAFQIGQLSALLHNKEIFTKEGLSEFNPKLKPFLNRDKDMKLEDLTIELRSLLNLIDAYGKECPSIWSVRTQNDEIDE